MDQILNSIIIVFIVWMSIILVDTFVVWIILNKTINEIKKIYGALKEFKAEGESNKWLS
jgi:hypothetical protein